MNMVYVHLIISHFPVVGLILSIILLMASGLLKSRELLNVTLASLAFVAVMAFPVYFTGGFAEEKVEHLPWASEQLIERHEDWASAAVVSAGVTAIAASGILFMTLRSKKIPSWLLPGFLVLVSVTFVLLARTANLGGKIRHTEIHTASVNDDNGALYHSESRGAGEHEDDD